MTDAARSILVVEDEPQIRKFLRISLESHGYTVHEARLAAAGLELCATVRPDLIVLDLGLPDLTGHEFISRVREWSQVPIIVVSVERSESAKVLALDAGANDYVTKPFGISELMARIRVVLRNLDDTRESPVLELQGLRLNLAQHEVEVDGETIHLTKKEYDLLKLIAVNRGQVLTHQHILREVWGPAQQDETHYLRVLVGQLRQKLGDDPADPRFIVTVQGVGYRFSSH
ncbi:MAG: response regulator [Xanthomonadales bacterium]|nr:response regulator [Xanthomonadales bacterium]